MAHLKSSIDWTRLLGGSQDGSTPDDFVLQIPAPDVRAAETQICALVHLGNELVAAGWGNFSAHPVHTIGLVAEHGRLLRLALYYRRSDDLWVARIGIQGAQLVAVEHADPRVAFTSAHAAALRVLRETLVTLSELGLDSTAAATATSNEAT